MASDPFPVSFPFLPPVSSQRPPPPALVQGDTFVSRIPSPSLRYVIKESFFPPPFRCARSGGRTSFFQLFLVERFLFCLAGTPVGVTRSFLSPTFPLFVFNLGPALPGSASGQLRRSAWSPASFSGSRPNAAGISLLRSAHSSSQSLFLPD